MYIDVHDASNQLLAADGGPRTRSSAPHIVRYSLQGGAVGWGCSGWGVVFYSKTAYNMM